MNQNLLYLCYGFIPKLVDPSINSVSSGGDLVQVILAVSLTNSQLDDNTSSKNITVCSSSCKNQEVSGIPSFTCREGKASCVSNAGYQPDRWIELPYHEDTIQFIFKERSI